MYYSSDILRKYGSSYYLHLLFLCAKMKFYFFSSKPLSLIITKLLFFLIIPLALIQAKDDEQYMNCSKEFTCGSKTYTDVKYPFWGDERSSNCGVHEYQIKCEETNEYPVFEMSSQKFDVLSINRSSHIMKIVRADLSGQFMCTNDLNDTVINPSLVNYETGTQNITLFYSCNSDFWDKVGDSENFSCGNYDKRVFSNKSWNETFWQQASKECEKNITFPVMGKNWNEFLGGTLSLPDIIRMGFEVGYGLQTKTLDLCSNCEDSGGVCGTNITNNQFSCFCKDGPRLGSCPRKSSEVARNIGIGLGVGGVFLIAGIIFAVHRYRNKKGKPIATSWESRDISSYGSSLVVDLEKSNLYYGVQVFDYDDLKEATNNFDENKELGDGGFGVVYQGKLRDGRVVAVKRLYERNFRRVGQFMNEVEILARLRHQNLVTLYGCTSRNSRELLLVYEYVSNGTVADHLHGDRSKPGSLTWTTRMRIAIESANALCFLHKKDVIHRDVKTNNILLDDNFVVKVADFGLSRLYPNNVTHVSTAPQGTPGYVDPEYHQCYRLTDKSDVYSFGVVLVELISSMPAVDIARHGNDINLSNMAIEKIQNNGLRDIVDPYLGFDTDFKVRKMITVVAELAFRCLQNERDMRPSMKEVLEILEMVSNENIVEEMEISGGDDVLSRNDPPTMSSDSTISNPTTPNSNS